MKSEDLIANQIMKSSFSQTHHIKELTITRSQNVELDTKTKYRVVFRYWLVSINTYLYT